MSPNDTNDGQTVSPNPTVTNTPDPTSVPPQTATPASAPPSASTPAPTSQPAQANPTPSVSAQAPAAPKTQQPAPSAATVTNQPHPAVKRASLLYDIAQTLAGGPRYQTTVDADTGQTTRTPVPLTGRQIGMAIALEAISGSLSGLAQKGPNAAAKAGVAGLQQGAQQFQQRQAAEQQQTEEQQRNYQNQANSLAQKAATYETNSRTLLNTAQAQNLGLNAVKDLIAINRASGVLDVDPALLENSGVPMTESELLAAMQSGAVNVTSHLGPVAGYTIGPKGQIETTHLVIKDTSAKVPLTQQMWDTYANADVPGFTKGSKVGSTITIPLRTLQNANEQLGERTLTDHKLNDLRSVLDGTPWADKVPAKVDFSQPGVARAMTALSRYQSHDATNAADPYLALQQMGTAKRNPDGTLQPNPDAKYADTIAQAMGGWPLLEAAHNQIEANRKSAADFAVIDSADKANAVVAAPKRFTPEQVQSAKNFLALSNEQGARKAADDARARAIAEGTDVQAMYRFGRNPITGEQLTLSNAPDSMLVDSSGRVVPQDMTSLWKPTASERQTADTATQALAISADLRKAVTANPNIVGPLLGRSEKGLAAAGLGKGEAQRLLNQVGLLQSAIVKAHTGRMSDALLTKANGMVNAAQNADQFLGGLQGVDSVMQRYAQEGSLRTVADYRAEQAQTSQASAVASASAAGVPPGATAARDASGKVVGYKTAAGQYVSLGAK